MSFIDDIISEEIKKEFNYIIESHQDIVDNIQLGIDLVDYLWLNPDNTWWIKIEARYKDYRGYNKRHPQSSTPKWWSSVGGMDGTRRENHVGYVIVRGRTKEDCVNSIKNAVVHLNPWAAQQMGTDTIYSNGNAEAIKIACNAFFARAYMTINKRSMEFALKKAREDKRFGRNKGRELHHRLGKPQDSKFRPGSLIDCDIDNPLAQKELSDYLNKQGINPFRDAASHDGRHYIIFDKDKQKNLDFSFLNNNKNYSSNNRPGDPPVLLKPDANMLLYSTVGK